MWIWLIKSENILSIGMLLLLFTYDFSWKFLLSNFICLSQLFVDLGSHQLEDKHADLAFSSLHFLESSFSAIWVLQVISHLNIPLSATNLALWNFNFMLCHMNIILIFWFYFVGERSENGLLS